MLRQINLKKVLFLDIETVSQNPSYSNLTENLKAHWQHKTRFLSGDKEPPEETYGRAGIYAEFGKIVCISVGIVYTENNEKKLRLKSFYGDDEYELLVNFFQLLTKSYASKNSLLCAHNGKEFDFPYIARRALINQLELPNVLDLAGKKP